MTEYCLICLVRFRALKLNAADGVPEYFVLECCALSACSNPVRWLCAWILYDDYGIEYCIMTDDRKYIILIETE
jgi:hypothetical protein